MGRFAPLGRKIKMNINVVLNDERSTGFLIECDNFHVESDYLVVYRNEKLIFVAQMSQVLFAGVTDNVK
jgi:hypothetical protein